MAAKEYTLVRWIEDNTIGVMLLSAVTNESRPCAGDVVAMKWRKTYESEILKIPVIEHKDTYALIVYACSRPMWLHTCMHTTWL